MFSKETIHFDLSKYQHIVDRFYKSVNIKNWNDCWLWSGSFQKNGYGYLSVSQKNLSAKRVSWAIHNKKNPGNNFICHKCDNPKCVNPAHLYAGTPQDNSNDMKERNRSLRGEKCPAAKLSNDDVVEIKNRYHNGELQRLLAKEFGVTREHVNKIINGKKRVYGV